MITQELSIGGFQKVSLVDFPDRIASVVFLNGCYFRCGFCFNPNLVQPEEREEISSETVFSYLRKRRGLLDGVVVTGGEPVLQSALPELLRSIRDLGYEIKLDTSGYFPERIRPLIDEGLVDYIAMDIKGSPEQYSRITAVPVEMDRIRESIRMLMNAGIAYEFRSTLVRDVQAPEDILAMAKMIEGAEKFCLQTFRTDTPLLNPAWKEYSPYDTETLKREIVSRVEAYVQRCEVR